MLRPDWVDISATVSSTVTVTQTRLTKAYRRLRQILKNVCEIIPSAVERDGAGAQ